MAIYSQAQLSTATTVANWDILASSSNSPRMMELALNLGAATATIFGIGRPGNDGSQAQTSGLNLLPENPGDPASQTKTAIAWGTAPTVPTNYFRRIYLPGVIGAGIIWTFPRGLIMAASRGIVNFTPSGTSSALTHVWAVCDE